MPDNILALGFGIVLGMLGDSAAATRRDPRVVRADVAALRGRCGDEVATAGSDRGTAWPP